MNPMPPAVIGKSNQAPQNPQATPIGIPSFGGVTPSTPPMMFSGGSPTFNEAAPIVGQPGFPTQPPMMGMQPVQPGFPARPRFGQQGRQGIINAMMQRFGRR